MLINRSYEKSRRPARPTLRHGAPHALEGLASGAEFLHIGDDIRTLVLLLQSANAILFLGMKSRGFSRYLGEVFIGPLHALFACLLHGRGNGEARQGTGLPPNHLIEDRPDFDLVEGPTSWQIWHFLKTVSPFAASWANA